MSGVGVVLFSSATAFVLIFLIFKLIDYIRYIRRRNVLIEKIPGPPAHLLWGNLREFPGPNEAGLKYQVEQTKKYPIIARGWLGPFIPTIMVNHPTTVSVILKSSEPKAHSIYKLIFPWVGDGLLLSKGEKWKRNRRLLTPAFHFEVLKPYQKLNNVIADELLDKLKKFNEDYFEAFTVMSMYTLDVILQCAFSYKTDCQSLGNKHPYVHAVNELVDLATDRFFKPWVHNEFIYLMTSDGRRWRKHCNYVHKVAEEVISKRKAELSKERPKSKYLDFLDILLTARDDNGEGLTDLELRNEVDTFMFEGHDTTASALSWTLCSLAQNPDIQTKVQAEIDSVLDGRDSEEILWDDLQKLTYLTMCIKEGLRMHCPVPFIQRETTKEFEMGGYKIPKGSLISLVMYQIHHNPTVWENSMEFIPERFTPENSEIRDPYAFVPFSAGPRNCIGQTFAMNELKTVIARILRRFNIELDPHHKIEKREAAIMRAENGIMMRAVPRKRKQ